MSHSYIFEENPRDENSRLQQILDEVGRDKFYEWQKEADSHYSMCIRAGATKVSNLQAYRNLHIIWRYEMMKMKEEFGE